MKIKALVSFVFVGISLISFSQVLYVPKQVREANTQYRNENFCEAASLCAKAYYKIERGNKSSLRMKGDMAFKTAECYRQTENAKDAHEWYEKAIVLKYYERKPIVHFYNGEMLRALGEHAKAKESYTAYKALVPNDKRADIGIRSCDINKDFKINKTRHIVSNVSRINLEVFDMAPMMANKKQNQLVFSSTRKGGISTVNDPRSCEYYMDLWVADIDKKGNFLEPRLLPGQQINTVDNEGSVCFDGRMKVMFFTRCPNVRKVNLGCDIWRSELKGKEWGEPTKLELKDHDSISVGHPCVTPDGKFLIFASDLPGGFGGKDLWYTTYDKKKDTWSTPVNMGPEINTPGNELFPTFALNGDLLYASDGLPGMGGLDIFRAKQAGEQLKWENPENLGYPMNSSSNDYALIEVSEKKGFFTSERVGSVGKNQRPDIWMYDVPPNVFDLTVNVMELFDNSKKVAGANVSVVASDGGKWEGTTNDNGSIFWDKKPNGDRYINENSSYTITVSKEGYTAVKPQSFTTEEVKIDQKFIFDMPMIKDEPIRLPEVRYPLNKWELLKDSTINSKDSLNYVYDLLVKYPGLKLELISHTDARSGDIYNQVLSENRAKSCIKYLVEEKGIDARRLVPVGQGERVPKKVWRKGDEYFDSQPADTAGVEEVVLEEKLINSYKRSNRTLFTQLHQWNRRTEGRVLGMDFDPATAPPVPEDFFKFKNLPKNTSK
ncbi:MAG: hypothetical protein EP338_03175 [Bacteroidetes bacterium]|nr:MAG: hypothetical protein EP338_03175 [Bacteroidota bacterium]